MTTEPLTEQKPEPAADPMAETLCPSCGVTPHVITGLPVFVTFTAEGVATVGVDTAELGDLRADEIGYAHEDGCPFADGMDDDLRANVLPHVAALARRVGDAAEPSMRVTL